MLGSRSFSRGLDGLGAGHRAFHGMFEHLRGLFLQNGCETRFQGALALV